jgi:hypothetical protein
MAEDFNKDMSERLRYPVTLRYSFMGCIFYYHIPWSETIFWEAKIPVTHQSELKLMYPFASSRKMAFVMPLHENY